jgi:ubiquinone/menaquinone biosynthesis C-methylase UbiE
MNTLNEKVTDYCSKRAHSYSDAVNHTLSKNNEKEAWEKLIYSQIPSDKKLKILDIGTGPGIFVVLLGSNPHFEVTATDSSPGMLAEAKKNAEANHIIANFHECDAHTLPFENETFDVIISRNVTWNLPHPEKAYKEWKRVLKKGGKIITFDANWYLRLYDADLQKKYNEVKKYEDHEKVPQEMRNKMEELAKTLPLSKEHRPSWDIKILGELGFEEIFLNTNINHLIYDEIEMKIYSVTPMFMVSAIK